MVEGPTLHRRGEDGNEDYEPPLDAGSRAADGGPAGRLRFEERPSGLATAPLRRTRGDSPLRATVRDFHDTHPDFENAFFPIDDQLFGDEGYRHNYHFTLEVSTRFRYQGGEVFTFEGDDDLWVFMNRRRAIDLGGLHNAERRTVDLDLQASTLGLVVGEVYPMHLFFAKRHTVGYRTALAAMRSHASDHR